MSQASTAWLCGVRQAFTSYDNPKGNADVERFRRTLEEGLVWLYEWTSQAVLFATLDRWLADDDATYLHSASGHRAPNAVEAAHLGHATPWQRLGKRGAVQEIDPVPG